MHAEKLCHKWLSNVLPEMHGRRLSALSAVVGGAFRGGKLNVTSLGRSIQSGAKTKHNIKRADRLFSNAHLHEEQFRVYANLAQQVIGNSTQPIILVDWSDIDARREFFLLRAAVAVKGRSLTVYEEVHTRLTKEKRTTHNQFLRRLKDILPPLSKPVIVTDAGFRTPWFKQVRALGWDFVGRVRNREKVKQGDNSLWIGAKSLYRKATNKPQKMEDALLTRSHPLQCSLILYKSKPKGRKRFTKMKRLARSRTSLVNAARSKEPWLLATSLAQGSYEIVQLYFTRMQIEEAFRDLKCPRYGLSLYHNGTYKLLRMKVLVLIGSLTTTFAWLLGATSRSLKKHRQFQANTTSSVTVLSNVFLGIQICRNSKLKIPWNMFNHEIKILASSLAQSKNIYKNRT